MNTFGTLFRLTDFGESHGPAIGGVVDGMPAGFKIDFDAVARQLARRRPGQSPLTTQRSEPDEVTFPLRHIRRSHHRHPHRLHHCQHQPALSRL